MKNLLLAGGVILFAVAILAILIVVMLNKGKYEVIEENYEDNIVDDKSTYKTKKKKKLKGNVNSNGLVNYDVYIMNFLERAIWSLAAMGVLFAVGMVFYGNKILALMLSLFGLIYPKIKTKSIIAKRKEKLLLQFKESLYSISASLSTGKAVPTAFNDAYEEMKLIFNEDKDSYIVNELLIINRRLDRNETIEDALLDLSTRSTLEDIGMFAEIFSACNKTGGNLKKVILESSKMIGDKITVKQEIATMISGKKFEAKILTFIPIGIVFMLKLMAPDMIENLYSPLGNVMATVAIFLIIIATLWSEKIMRIEV